MQIFYRHTVWKWEKRKASKFPFGYSILRHRRGAPKVPRVMRRRGKRWVHYDCTCIYKTYSCATSLSSIITRTSPTFGKKFQPQDAWLKRVFEALNVLNAHIPFSLGPNNLFRLIVTWDTRILSKNLDFIAFITFLPKFFKCLFF